MLLRALLLSTLVFSGCSLPVRIVKVTPEERAAEALVRGREAQARGDLETARREYRAATREQPTLDEAWWALIAVLDHDGRTELRKEVAAWRDRSPHDPRTTFLLARLTAGAAEQSLYRLAWSQREYTPLLDPWVMRPRGYEGWSSYVELLESFDPETPLLTAWTILARCQVGLPVSAAMLAAVPEESPEGALARAAVLMTAGTSGSPEDHVARVRRGLRPAMESDSNPLLLWEARRRWLRLAIADGSLVELDEELAGLRRERRAGELDVLEASYFARHGRTEEARELLARALPECVLPQVRLAGAVLLYGLEREAPSSHARNQLREAIEWAPAVADLEVLAGIFIAAGDAESAALALDTAVVRLGDVANDRSWTLAADLKTLSDVGDAEISTATWEFLRQRSITERRVVFDDIPEDRREHAIVLALRHWDARLRTLALGLARDGSSVSFGSLPSMESDPDARVRGAWLVLAADQGGAVAREAILAGRRDADDYVREIADGLPLPQ